MDELEEAILALRAAGWAVPSYTILDNGVVYFEYGQTEQHPPIHSEEPRGDIG